MELLGAVDFAGLARAAVERVVAGERLPGARGGEHGQEKREVLEARQDFLDAHDGDVDFRQGAGEARVAFVSVIEIMPVSATAKWRR